MKRIIIPIICLFLCSCATITAFKNVAIDNTLPLSSKITLTMVGDALVHTPIYKDAYKNGVYDFGDIFSEIKDEFKLSDLLYYNAETIIGGEKLGFSGYPNFNTPKEFGETMINLGFNVVSRANNHTLDKGEAGVINSCNFWNKYSHVLTNGSACTNDERNHIKIMETNGITYALLSYTIMTNGIKPKEKYYVNIYEDEQVKVDMESIRDNVDLVLVAMHWGDEYKHIPNSEQRRIASYLTSLGVNIIIGTHPHVIEPIEWINDTLVIYSLGNFISAQTTQDDYARRIGLIVNVDVIKVSTEDKSKVILDNLNTSLVYTFSNNYKNYKLYPFNKLNNNILLDYQSLKLKYDAIIKYYDKRIVTN